MRQLLSVREVAEMVGVTVQTVYMWVQCGDLPSMRAGKLIRIDRDELDAWLKGERHGDK